MLGSVEEIGSLLGSLEEMGSLLGSVEEIGSLLGSVEDIGSLLGWRRWDLCWVDRQQLMEEHFTTPVKTV